MSDHESEPCRSSLKAQRLRLRYSRGPEAVEVGHLDVSHVWERAFEAAGIAVSHSEGKHPRPRITQAAALPGDATSDGELLDVVLAKLVPPADVPARSRESDAMSKELKARGFTFVGSTICYAYMQAAGLVNDHLVDCFRYRDLS